MPPLLQHCCYILTSENWPTPYTGKTQGLASRLHRHNNPSLRSRAYTKGKGPWRVAAAVFGLRTNREAVWLERALKRRSKGRRRVATLSATQTAVLSAMRVVSRVDNWVPVTHSTSKPLLHLHVFAPAFGQPLAAEASQATACLFERELSGIAAGKGDDAQLHLHRSELFQMQNTSNKGDASIATPDSQDTVH